MSRTFSCHANKTTCKSQIKSTRLQFKCVERERTIGREKEKKHGMSMCDNVGWCVRAFINAP